VYAPSAEVVVVTEEWSSLLHVMDLSGWTTPSSSVTVPHTVTTPPVPTLVLLAKEDM
jgi:hypothetical protein